jgi:hypothetical protein
MILLLLQENFFERISKSFSDPGEGKVGSFIALGLLALSIILLGLALLNAWMKRRSHGTPLAVNLFKSLCTENQLSRSEIRMLKKMCSSYEIRDPASIFIRRSLFDSSSSALNLDAGSVDALRKKLYQD